MVGAIVLRAKSTETLFPKPPFNFDATVYVPHHFPEPDSQWQKGVVWQTMNFDDNLLGIKMKSHDTEKIGLTIFSERPLKKQEIEKIISELKWRYGLDEDLSEFYKRFRNDKFLKSTFRKLRSMRINCANSLYELLIITIVLQNATVRRTVQMMNNLLNTFGKKIRFDNKELFCFWSPSDMDRITEGGLKSLKVGYRAGMIKKVSECFSNGEINEFRLRGMPMEEARKELMKLYGIGPASAQIISTEYLRKYDEFVLKGRFWEQKILSKIIFGKKLVPEKRIMTLFKKRYGKWQGLAFHYIFTDLFWRHKEKRIKWLEKEIRM